MPPDIRCRSVAVATCLSSGLKAAAAAAVIKASTGILRGITVYTNGTDDVTVVAYDNASAASGTELAKIIVAGEDGSGGVIGIEVEAKNGITLSIVGTGGSALAYYI